MADFREIVEKRKQLEKERTAKILTGQIVSDKEQAFNEFAPHVEELLQRLGIALGLSSGLDGFNVKGRLYRFDKRERQYFGKFQLKKLNYHDHYSAFGLVIMVSLFYEPANQCYGFEIYSPYFPVDIGGPEVFGRSMYIPPNIDALKKEIEAAMLPVLEKVLFPF